MRWKKRSNSNKYVLGNIIVWYAKFDRSDLTRWQRRLHNTSILLLFTYYILYLNILLTSLLAIFLTFKSLAWTSTQLIGTDPIDKDEEDCLARMWLAAVEESVINWQPVSPVNMTSPNYSIKSSFDNYSLDFNYDTM